MKTTKFLLLIAITGISLIYNPLSAQETQRTANKILYAEFGGLGFLNSINFSSRFSSDSRHGFGYRAGLGFMLFQPDLIDSEGNPYWGATRLETSIPIGLNYVFGKIDSPHTFEFGVGVTYKTVGTLAFGNVLGFSSFTYRRMPVNGGFSWHIGVTPIIFPLFYPWAGIGAGWVF